MSQHTRASRRDPSSASSAITPGRSQIRRSKAIGVDIPWRREVPAVIAGYVALFFVITFPLLLLPTRTIVTNHGDGFFDMLLFWYARRGELFAPNVPTLFYPWGAPLGPEQAYWLVPVLSVPLQWVMPLPLVFNVLCCVFFVASGTAMYLVVRECRASCAGAFVAGVLLLLSPAYLNEMAQGIPENMGLQWVLLFLWCGLRLRDVPSTRLALWAGVFFGLSWLQSWYLGAFAVLCLPLLPLRRMLAATAPAAVLLGMMAFGMLAGGHAGADVGYDHGVAQALVNGQMLGGGASDGPALLREDARSKAEQATSGTLFNSIDLSGLLVRYRMGRLRNTLPGILLLALAALGLWRAPQRTWPWFLTALLFVALSLGPILVWRGIPRFVLPTDWVYTHFPLVARMRPGRCMLAATMMLCVLAGVAIPHVRRRGAGLLLICALTLMQGVEVFVVQVGDYGLRLAAADAPDFYHRLAAHPQTDGAVIEYPFFPYNIEQGRHMYYQTVHRHAMLNYNFLTGRSLEKLAQAARTNRLLAAMLGSDAPIRRTDAQALLDRGLRWFILHTVLRPLPYEPLQGALFDTALYDRLEVIYGPPGDEGDGILLFDLRAPRADAWSADGTARAPHALKLDCTSSMGSDARRPARVATVDRGSDVWQELRGWTQGEGRIRVWQNGTCVGSVALDGSALEWVRIPLRQTNGRPLLPPSLAPLTVTTEESTTGAKGRPRVQVVEAVLWTRLASGTAKRPSSSGASGCRSTARRPPSASPGARPIHVHYRTFAGRSV